MASIKLSVTHRGHLADKYDDDALAAIDAAVEAWIAADVARGIQTFHVALDDAEAMQALGTTPFTGRVTPNKVKAAIDRLWKQLTPDYLVLFGAEDVLPYFTVDNPSYDPNGDDDPVVPTDNPYGCSKSFRASRLSSYLVPDRVVGRIPDMVGDNSPAWFLKYLATATASAPRARSDYGKTYASCCDAWKGAGEHATQAIGESVDRLLVSPPQKDDQAAPRKRLKSLLHMIKCHGAQLDPRFYGQKGNSYPVSLDSASLKSRVKPDTVAAAMCCYGAQVYSPSDPAASVEGQWPIASTYLRKGALGMAGSTMIAWVGVRSMMCADWIATGFLKNVLAGASLGRAFLDSKQDYIRWIDQQGQVPDIADEKTMLEFVLLGDPSVHAVLPEAAPLPAAATATREVAATAAMGALAGAERRMRRMARVNLAGAIRNVLPTRSLVEKVSEANAKAAFAAVKALLGKGLADWNMKASKVRVHKVVSHIRMPAPKAGLALAAMSSPAPSQRESMEYYWSGRRTHKGHKQVRLVKVEADADGNVLRTTLRHSS